MSDDTPRGPEDLPPKQYVRDFPLVVLVKDIKSGRIIREEHVNYSDSDARKWIGKLTFYMCNQGYSIVTMAEKDYHSLEDEKP
jgi:hypothetical protein